jgi:hypothetical protein
MPEQENEFKYERMWNKTYPSQAICMYWESVTSTLLIGLDEGKINMLKVPAESQFVRFDEVISTFTNPLLFCFLARRHEGPPGKSHGRFL